MPTSLCFLALLFIAAARPVHSQVLNGDVNFAANFPGVYHFIDIMQTLQTSSVNSIILDIICPRTLTFAAGSDASTFVLDIGADLTTSRQCRADPAGNATANFQRILVNTPSPSPNVAAVNISLQGVYNYFPLFRGAFSDRNVSCPLLETVSSNTPVVVHDVGYLNTALNHYQSSNTLLGEYFNSTFANLLAPVQNAYYISWSVASSQGYICTYLTAEQRTALLGRVEAILNPTSSPSPSTSTSPSPTIAPSPEESMQNSACFPRNATVVLADGSQIPIHALRVGQEVRDSSTTTSRVLMHTHADPYMRSSFVRLRTAHSTLLLSPGHILPVNNVLCTASQVRIGDVVRTTDGDATVVEVDVTVEHGLFNPQTSSGTIAVAWQGIPVVATTYTAAVAPRAAHALLAPLRALSAIQLTAAWLSSHFVRGNIFWPNVIGAFSASKV